MTTGASVANNNPVLFSTTLVNDQTDSVTYAGAGTFVFTRPGNYYVSWSVAIQLTTGADVNFGLLLGTTVVAEASGYVQRGVHTGSALITVAGTAVPTVMQLINRSGNTIPYDDNTDILANIVIFEVS